LVKLAPDLVAIRGRPPYLERNGYLFALGDSGYIGLANFTARVVEQIGRYDARGEWVVTALRIELRHRDPRVPRRSFVVRVRSFRRGLWLSLLGPDYVVERGAKLEVCRAVDWMSGFGAAIPKVVAPLQGRADEMNHERCGSTHARSTSDGSTHENPMVRRHGQSDDGV
jgi:hypothetical protein